MSNWKRLRSTPLLPLALLLGVAAAAPVLPGSTVAEIALQSALAAPTAAVAAPAQPTSAASLPAPVKAAPAKAVAAPVKPAPAKPAPAKAAAPVKAAPAKAAPKPTAEQLRQQNIAKAQAAAPQRTGRSAVVRATSYTSLASQTDSTPFITATGTRTRFGVIAVSRDLLRVFPYGTKVMLEDLSGTYSKMLAGKVFVVEDTMNARLSNTIDVWLPTNGQSVQWGARSVRITAVK